MHAAKSGQANAVVEMRFNGTYLRNFTENGYFWAHSTNGKGKLSHKYTLILKTDKTYV